jgi:hypothetical protein
MDFGSAAIMCLNVNRSVYPFDFDRCAGCKLVRLIYLIALIEVVVLIPVISLMIFSLLLRCHAERIRRRNGDECHQKKRYQPVFHVESLLPILDYHGAKREIPPSKIA